MGIEQIVNQKLNKFPGMKKNIKRVYQRTIYTLSPKIKSSGDIIRISPDDPKHEYFFGYYDKSPWDATDRYMLCLKAKDTWSDVSPREAAQILLIDTEDDNKVTVLGETNAWNIQMGCMLQWLGPDYSSRVIYNDFREGKYCSIILTLSTMEEKIIPFPVYSVSSNGNFALSLDFSRLHRLRPGYGYYNAPEETANEKLPNKTSVWRVDLVDGEITPVLKYTDFANFEVRSEMSGAEHKINHIMLNPNNQRFMVLHRWSQGQKKYSRLVTCNIDGTDMYNLSDDDMVSHCFWKTNDQIIAFENKKQQGTGYYLMKDQTQKYSRFWEGIDFDGHPSYSPDGNLVVFDRYPDRARVAAIMVSNSENKSDDGVNTVAKVFAPFKYDNDTRCDLHPRWNRTGDKICFDSVFEGKRGLYVVNIDSITMLSSDKIEKQEEEVSYNIQNMKAPLITVIIPVYNTQKFLKRCLDSVLNQTYKNLEIILVNDGSSDKSAELCEKIAENDSRIVLIHKENGGLSSARNAGLDSATGEYITFLDSDDWLALDIYERCVDVIKSMQCDIVDFKVIFTNGTQVHELSSDISKPIVLKGKDILHDYLYRGQTEKAPFSVCRKVYKRTLYDSIRFPVGKVNEDIATNFEVLMGTEKLVHINNTGYYYYQNDNSITNGSLKRQDFDLLEASEKLCKLAEQLDDPEISQLAQIKIARSYFSLLAKAAVGGFSDDIRDKNKCIAHLTKELRRNYFLLMQSPVPLNRKLMISALYINFNCLAVPIKIYKQLRNGKSR